MTETHGGRASGISLRWWTRRGFTNVFTSDNRKYSINNFVVAAPANKAEVFNLKGKFLKSITATEFTNWANSFATGLYIIQWKSGNRSHTVKYLIGTVYNRFDER